MSYAVRNDGAGWRAVAGPEDVGPDEYFSFSQPELPPAPLPEVVTMRQARLALLSAGLLTSVNAAVSAMPGAEGEAARIEWEFSSTVDRQRPLVQALAAALGWSEAQLDALFIAADAL